MLREFDAKRDRLVTVARQRVDAVKAVMCVALAWLLCQTHNISLSLSLSLSSLRASSLTHGGTGQGCLDGLAQASK